MLGVFVVVLIASGTVLAQSLDLSPFDKTKILTVMDQIALMDMTRPDFKSDSAKFMQENADLLGSFSDTNATVDKGYYGVAGGIGRAINLTFTKPGILATYGGMDNVLTIKTNSPLIVLVSAGTNKFKVEKTDGFTGAVTFVTQMTSSTTFEGGTVMSFEDFWRQHRQ